MPLHLTRRAFHASVLGLASSLGAQQRNCNTLPAVCPPLPAGTPRPFEVESGIQNIQRKPLSLVVGDANETSRLRLAYQKLRELSVRDPSDPRGWAQQANIHCFRCGGNPDQADVHQSWIFLPWHRAYLYYHERILAELIGDPTFRLPYWDWDVPANRSLPGIYRARLAGGKPNSLFDASRGVNNGATMPIGVILPDNINAMNAQDFPTFGGTATDGGQLEQTSHGMIHVWTSSPRLNPSFTDMGCLPTAARDPIFYSHHGNLDRLWAEWNRRDTTHHVNPGDADWLATKFTFFDHKKVLRSIAIGDVLDTANKLGYSYPPGAALAVPGAPHKFEVTFDSATRTIRLSDDLKNRILGPGALNATRFLVVEGAALPSNPGVYFIFAGTPPANRAATASNYLGFVARLASGHRHEAQTRLMLNVSTTFAQRASAAQGVQLTYVPAFGRSAATRLDYRNVYLIER